VIVTIMVLELRAPDQSVFSALASVAHGRQLRSELSVHCYYFTIAMLAAFVAPRLAFGLICIALILHLRPEARASRF